MLLTTENGNGTVGTRAPEAAEAPAGNGAARRRAPVRVRLPYEVPEQGPTPALALFCYEGPGAVTRFVARVAGPLAGRGVALHLFARTAFELDAPGAVIHV